MVINLKSQCMFREAVKYYLAVAGLQGGYGKVMGRLQGGYRAVRGRLRSGDRVVGRWLWVGYGVTGWLQGS